MRASSPCLAVASALALSVSSAATAGEAVVAPGDGGCGTALDPREEPLRVLHEEMTEIVRRQMEFQSGQILYQYDVFHIPLWFHVLRRSNGTGGISQAQLDQTVVDANVAFEPMSMLFCVVGMDFVDDDGFYDGLSTNDDYDAVRMVNTVPGVINVYFAENMESPSDPDFNICGISSYTTSPVQGIVMKNACTGVPEDRATFPHELGHYFNLLHTHESYGGKECADGRNCQTKGDKLCDTPADPKLTADNVNEITCAYTGNAPGPCVNDDPYDPDLTNFMSYAPKPCRNRFTPQQRSLARSTLIALRPDLPMQAECPVLGACGAGGGSCYQSHAGPGCDDPSCCVDVCLVDPFCCAGDWDFACSWRASMTCRDIVLPPWNTPNTPLGLARVEFDPSGFVLRVSDIGSSGDDGVLSDLGAADNFETRWRPLDPLDRRPIGAFVETSAVGFTGGPRPRPVGTLRATKRSGGEVSFAEVSADFSPVRGGPFVLVRIFDGSVPVEEAEVFAPDGIIATASFLPDGLGVPPPVRPSDLEARFVALWSASTFIQLTGGPSASGDRMEVYALDAESAVDAVEMVGVTAAGIDEIEIESQRVSGSASRPANDDCRRALPVDEEMTAFSTLDATTDGPDQPPACGGRGITFGQDVWYSYAAPCTGTVTVSTCDAAGFDTQLAVYAGVCGDLALLACSNDSAECTGGTSRLEFQATCGEHYLLRVGGVDGATGRGDLTVTCAGRCPGVCPADLDHSERVDFGDILAVLANWGPCAGCPEDLDESGAVDFGDILEILGLWGPCPDREG